MTRGPTRQESDDQVSVGLSTDVGAPRAATVELTRRALSFAADTQETALTCGRETCVFRRTFGPRSARPLLDHHRFPLIADPRGARRRVKHRMVRGPIAQPQDLRIFLVTGPGSLARAPA